MVKGKGARSKKKDIKIIDENIIGEGANVIVPKGVEENENKTLIWFVIVVGIVFAAVLIPYFFVESNKSFELGGVDWIIEDYAEPVGEIFHGRFISLTNPSLNYNIFFRTDPRTNDVLIEGKIDEFWNHEAVSWTPEVEACRGDLSRVMLDLGSFLKQGVGAGFFDSGFTDKEAAEEVGKNFLTCADAVERTIVIVDIGERRIVQDETSLSCYTIYAEDCDDSGVVEKFMTQAIIDFNA